MEQPPSVQLEAGSALVVLVLDRPALSTSHECCESSVLAGPVLSVALSSRRRLR